MDFTAVIIEAQQIKQDYHDMINERMGERQPYQIHRRCFDCGEMYDECSCSDKTFNRYEH